MYLYARAVDTVIILYSYIKINNILLCNEKIINNITTERNARIAKQYGRMCARLLKTGSVVSAAAAAIGSVGSEVETFFRSAPFCARVPHTIL